MQILNDYFGGKLTLIDGHAGTKHELNVSSPFIRYIPKQVNSYHNWGIRKDNLAKSLIPVAYDKNNNVEAFKHKKKKVFGIMWHPERDKSINSKNLKLLEFCLK